MEHHEDAPIRPRATMKDVAKASGVSPTTVSFVLNDVPGQTIPDSTRQRVLAAARRLDYSAHPVARALRRGTSGAVVLGLGGIRAGNSLNAFVLGFRREVEQAGLLVAIVAQTVTEPGVVRFLDAVAPRAVVDLATVYSGAADPDDGGWVDGLAAHTVTQLAHLRDRGHQDIATAVPVGAVDDPIIEARRGFVRDAAPRLGLRVVGELRLGEAAAGDVELAALRARHPGCTAVAAFDDEIALRTLAAMSDLGLRAPDDLAVIGFDDGPSGAIWRPALTTVHIEAEDYGRRAARAAIGLPRLPDQHPSSSIIMRETA